MTHWGRRSAIRESHRVILMAICHISGYAASIEALHVSDQYARIHIVSDNPQPKGFTCALVKATAEAFRKSNPGKKLYIVRLSSPDRDCFASFMSSHIGYEGLLRMRELNAARIKHCAEAILDESGYAIRIRRPAGDVEECTDGQNPLTLATGDMRLSLHWVEYWKSNESDMENVAAFAMSNSIKVHEAAKVFREFTNRYPGASHSLSIGTVPWFPANTLFPIFYPYGPRFKPPSQADFETLPHIQCEEDKGAARCAGYRTWKDR